MEKRQAELEKLMLEYEKECLSGLQKAYTEALADVKRNLKGLLASDQTQSIVYQVQYQENLQRQIETALTRLKSGSITSVNDFLNKTYEDGYLGTIYSIQGQGIPVNIGIDHEQMARTIQRRTDTMQFSQRLYDNVDRLGVAFKSQMSRGIANNSTYSKIAKQLALESEANYKQAMRIVRTEGGRVKSEAKLNSMQKAKDEGADIVKQWDATFDSKTRAEHRFLDGQIKEIGEPFVDSQGREAQAPHKFGVAEMDVNCRCIVVERARWAVEGEEMPNKVDNATGELVEAKNYKEWKEKYQRKQVEQKQTPSNAKVFDKNSKNLPSVGDYFKTNSNDLVKIKEVNDYNGIKSVTLENGQTVVLGNAKQDYKFTTEKINKVYSSQAKNVDKQFKEAFDNAVKDDETTNRILNNIDKLDTVAVERARKSKYSPSQLKMELASGEMDGTTYHEFGHSLDHLVAYKNLNGDSNFKWVSESIEDVRKEHNNELKNSIPDSLLDICNKETARAKEWVKTNYIDNKKIYDITRETMQKKYGDRWQTMGETMQKHLVNLEGQKELNKVLNSFIKTDEGFKKWGCLCDIYDAITNGTGYGSKKLLASHGFDYYNNQSIIRTSIMGIGKKQNAEIFANFIEMKMGGYAEQLEYLKRTSGKLYDALENTYSQLADMLERL